MSPAAKTQTINIKVFKLHHLQVQLSILLRVATDRLFEQTHPLNTIIFEDIFKSLFENCLYVTLRKRQIHVLIIIFSQLPIVFINIKRRIPVNNRRPRNYNRVGCRKSPTCVFWAMRCLVLLLSNITTTFTGFYWLAENDSKDIRVSIRVLEERYRHFSNTAQIIPLIF